MQYTLLSPEDGFLGLHAEELVGKNLKKTAVIVPFGLEASVSYGGGTAQGPEAIIEASHQVELFDEELWCEPHKTIGIETLAPFAVKETIPEALMQLESITSDILSSNKFPLILGGEHSLTAGSIRAFTKHYGKISILHFDAHADLRDGYDGEHYSHAAALRRCLDNPDVNLVSIGIRNISGGEIPFLEANKHRLHIFWAHEKTTWNIQHIVDALGNNPVYVSFDLDGFDSSLMPATGTPEPGGLFWYEATSIIKLAAQQKQIVGADIVELAPIEGLHACNFLAAKLAFKILSYALVMPKQATNLIDDGNPHTLD